MSTNYTININIHNLNNVTVGDIKITPPDVTDTVVECDGMDLQASPEEISHLECLLSREADTPIALDADEPVSLDDDEPVSLDDVPTSLDGECSGPSFPGETPYPLDLFYDEADEVTDDDDDDDDDDSSSTWWSGHERYEVDEDSITPLDDDGEPVSLDGDTPTSLDDEERNNPSCACCNGVCPSSAGSPDEDGDEDFSPFPSALRVISDDDAEATSLDDDEATSLD